MVYRNQNDGSRGVPINESLLYMYCKRLIEAHLRFAKAIYDLNKNTTVPNHYVLTGCWTRRGASLTALPGRGKVPPPLKKITHITLFFLNPFVFMTH